jgi:hypothetical protein
VVFINNACSVTSEPFHLLIHLPLRNTVISILCCHSWRILHCLTTKIELQHVAEQWCILKVEPTCSHSDCTSLTEHNGYPMICLDLAQYVVHLMSVRAQSDKLPEFYTQIALFEFSS